MTAATPAPRPRRSAPPRRSTRRQRWGRIPGRIILALCFVLGALALGAAVFPFTSTDDAGTELRCGPAVFEVLMPSDPAFDDTPENHGCADAASQRLLIAGGVLVGAMVVAGITERRTRRGSVRRDTRWLSSSKAGASRRRRDRRAAPRSPSRSSGPTAIDATSSSGRSRPPARR